jgi:hypothetical protein
MKLPPIIKSKPLTLTYVPLSLTLKNRLVNLKNDTYALKNLFSSVAVDKWQIDIRGVIPCLANPSLYCNLGILIMPSVVRIANYIQNANKGPLCPSHTETVPYRVEVSAKRGASGGYPN